MKDRSAITISACCILSITILLSYYMSSLQPNEALKQNILGAQNNALSEPTPDIIINNVTLTNPTKSALVVSITASQAVIIRKNGTIHCTDITSILTKNKKLIGNITAAKAFLDQEKKIITFLDAHGIIYEIELKGNSFRYNLTTNLITSSTPVEIYANGASFTGKDVTFDITKQHLTLHQATTLITQSSDTLQKR